MTQNKRIAVSLPKELEDKLIELRKTDKYCRCSFSEIVRQLFALGIEAEEKKETA